MKKQVVLLIFFISVSLSLSAQRDTTRIDSFWAASPHQPYLRSVLEAPVVSGLTAPRTITPRSQPICFDKIIKVKMTTGGRLTEACLFINTQTGLIGHTPIKQGTTGVCDIKPELPTFSLFVTSLAGNTYHYFNNRKKDEIEHRVTTNNSDQYQYDFTATGIGHAVLHRKTTNRKYCDNKVQAWAYRVDGRSETWFMFGRMFPESMTMIPKKFLGNYAVGYQYTDKGLYIIMQMESSRLNTKIVSITDADICFDPTPFEVFEEEMVTKVRTSSARNREKLQKKLADIKPDDPCGQAKRTSIQFQQQALDRQEENVISSTQGNLNQQIRTQQARSDGTVNYNDVIQASIYDTKVKICQTEDQLARSSGSNSSSRQRQQEKLTCLQGHLARQQQVQVRFREIDRQHAAQPGKAMLEKARLMMTVIAGCD